MASSPAPKSTSTSWRWSIVFKILVPIVLACLLYQSLPSNLLDSFCWTSTDQDSVPEIPISKVLKQNLALAKHSWEHGTLTYALLELQNPELTVFAGPGYGFDLDNPFPGAQLGPFPDGQLPKCGSGSGGYSGKKWGRYDDWTRVKGLRYAAGKIMTNHKRQAPVIELHRQPTGSPEDPAKKAGEGWLFYENGDRSAADAASLGWAALLLERAGATDPRNPVGAGRNAYGEAADAMVQVLFDKSRNLRFYVQDDSITEDNSNHFKANVGEKWAVSHCIDSPQLWADFVFMVPPFLAAYAVARQDETWLLEAAEQIKVYAEVLTVSEPSSQIGLWKHIVTQPRTLPEGGCCQDEGLWLTGNAWALAGIVRVLGVLENWEAGSSISGTVTSYNRHSASNQLLGIAVETLTALQLSEPEDGGLLKNYLDRPASINDTWIFGDAAGTALIASSVFRLAALGLLRNSQTLSWAHDLYKAVARHVGNDGRVGPVATVTSIPSQHMETATSEGQSMTILMYAALRDCTRAGRCSEHT